MPLLRAADFTDVPAYRIGDRAAVFDGVSGVWYHPSDGEMAVFHVLDRNPAVTDLRVRLLQTW